MIYKTETKKEELTDKLTRTTFLTLEEDKIIVEVSCTKPKILIERTFKNDLNGKDGLAAFCKEITNETDLLKYMGLL